MRIWDSSLWQKPVSSCAKNLLTFVWDLARNSAPAYDWTSFFLKPKVKLRSGAGTSLRLHIRKVISPRLFDCCWPTSSRMSHPLFINCWRIWKTHAYDTWIAVLEQHFIQRGANYSVQNVVSYTRSFSDIFRSTGASVTHSNNPETQSLMGHSNKPSLGIGYVLFVFQLDTTNFLRETCEQAAEINAVYMTSTSVFPFYLRSCLQFWHFALLTFCQLKVTRNESHFKMHALCGENLYEWFRVAYL